MTVSNAAGETTGVVYLCYIHRAAGGAPHFEVLPETTQSGAMDHAARMMEQRADAVRAEVWDGDRLVFSLPRESLANRMHSRPHAS
ncbi:MAG TPA: hypothetical protein VGH86_00455 [Phenylobacterium sp.]